MLIIIHYTSPLLFTHINKNSIYGAPSIPVITPTGNLVLKTNCPIISDASTNKAPTKAEGITFGEPFPTSFDAIGPAKNATKAIGPVVAVAKAIKNTALKTNITLTKFTLIPRVVANSPPSSKT